ncbi:MAG: hypothetical protein ACP5OG_02705 [Candidatus Nanoarchaeia archaeon]
MKKGIIVFAIFFIFFMSLLFSQEINPGITGDVITGEVITGEVITGRATEQTVNMNISVGGTAYPLILLWAPENETYLSKAIFLNYTTSNSQSVWYNIDNSSNTSVSSIGYVNISSEGEHILRIFANNSYGSVSVMSRRIIINSTRFRIYFSEYNSSTKGESTDFLRYPYKKMQNFSDIVLENTNYGKIKFNSAINMTNDSLPEDNLLDLDYYTGISSNNIELNSNFLPNFNKSATLSLYGLSFNNPRILKNGELCPESICKKESYTGGTLKFNVTGFSIYSAEETPVESGDDVPPSSSSSSGGGGGGGPSTPTQDLPAPVNYPSTSDYLVVDRPIIIINITQGSSKQEKVVFLNPTNEDYIINISHNANFVNFRENSFIVKAGEQKEVFVDIYAGIDMPVDAYTAKVTLIGSKFRQQINMLLNVRDRTRVFDVSVKSEKLKVGLESNLKSNIDIVNNGELRNIDVLLEYSIKDFNDKIYISHKENITIINTLNLIRILKLPSEISYGQYVFYTRVSYGNASSVSSYVFEVGDYKDYSLYYWIAGIVLVLAIIFYIILKRRKKKQDKPQNNA